MPDYFPSMKNVGKKFGVSDVEMIATRKERGRKTPVDKWGQTLSRCQMGVPGSGFRVPDRAGTEGGRRYSTIRCRRRTTGEREEGVLKREGALTTGVSIYVRRNESTRQRVALLVKGDNPGE